MLLFSVLPPFGEPYWPHLWTTLRDALLGFLLAELYDRLRQHVDREAQAELVEEIRATFQPRRTPLPLIPALLSHPSMREKLHRAVRGHAQLCFAPSWPELTHIVRRRTPSAIFVDPMTGPQEHCVRRIRELTADARAHVILYCQLSPETAALLLDLGQCGIRHVVFHRYDDAPNRLRAVLAAEGVRLSAD